MWLINLPVRTPPCSNLTFLQSFHGLGGEVPLYISSIYLFCFVFVHMYHWNWEKIVLNRIIFEWMLSWGKWMWVECPLNIVVAVRCVALWVFFMLFLESCIHFFSFFLFLSSSVSPFFSSLLHNILFFYNFFLLLYMNKEAYVCVWYRIGLPTRVCMQCMNVKYAIYIYISVTVRKYTCEKVCNIFPFMSYIFVV